MEDCIHCNPSAFIGREVSIEDRQPKIGGFRPDLVLSDKSGRFIILEIQQAALDRYHLYKSLEYRDLFAEKHKCDPPEIFLFCETIDDRFRPLLKTHRINLIEMEREDFINLAISKAPHIVSQYLTKTHVSSLEETTQKEIGRIEFKPLDWGSSNSPTDVLEHLYREFGRLNITIEDIPREHYRKIFWDTCNLLDRDLTKALRDIWLPGAWKQERLVERGASEKGWRAYPKLAKPRIEIIPYITIKRNLSVIWRPKNFDSQECDWSWWPGDGSYGWSRPNNELFFIRGALELHPGIHFNDWDDRINYEVLDGIFIALIKSCFNHFISVARTVIDVELLNDIELDLAKQEKEEGRYFQKQFITGWRIYDVEDRERQNQDSWIAQFESNYGFSFELFSEKYRMAALKAFGKPGQDHNIPKWASNELRKIGLKCTEVEVRQIREKIKAHHNSDVRNIIK